MSTPTPLTVHYQFIKKSSRPVVFFATIVIATSAHSNCTAPAFDATVEEQLAALPGCQNDAYYLAQLGRLLTSKGQYINAIDHLERALMLDPNLLGAQLDYAIALAGIGDLLSASQLLESIRSQPDVPSDIRSAITDARQRISMQQNAPLLAAKSPSAFFVTINLRQGYDSNLLGAPNISSLELTAPGGSVFLPLAGSSTPRPGSYTRGDIKLEYLHRQSDGSMWELAASALERKSSATPQARTKQTELSVGYTQNQANPFAGYVSTAFVGINTGSGTRFASQALALGLQLPVGSKDCNARAGFDWQNRNVRSNAILSGRYSGASTVVGCNAPWGGQWQISAKVGQDRPIESDRPGGIQNSATVRGVGIWPTSSLGVTGTGLVDFEYNLTRDSVGYSPLLSNAAVRQTQRLTTRFEYQRPLSQYVMATAGLEWSNQRANLALFRVKSWSPYAALRINW